jgi:[ribosomal protein S5]-alanine N-acetyltransferase
MTREYFLKTARLGLGRWTEGDAELARSLWGDPRVSEWIGGPFSEEQVQKRLHREIVAMTDHGMQYWPCFLLEDGDLVGCAGLRPYRDGLPELGFHFRPQYHKKGLAREAADAVIAYAFESLALPGIFAGHHPDNNASQRLLLKLGFRYLYEEIYPPTGLINPLYWLQKP